MANKKVSQLTSKPSVLVTDLFPIADPSTGQLYKTTISDLGTAIGSGVSSVNGLVGAVVLDTDDIQELVSPTNKWFTDTRARAALSASSPLAYNSGTGVFSIPAATSSQNGYLTSTDWTTFNSKQAALSGTGFVKISGTTISYDNSTYLTTSAAASTYLPLTGGTLTGALTLGTASGDNQTLLNLPASTSLIYREGVGSLYGFNIESTVDNSLFLTNTEASYNQTLYFGDSTGLYNIFGISTSNNSGSSWSARFVINQNGNVGLNKNNPTEILDVAGNGLFSGSLTANTIVKSGGTSSQFLKADGSVDSSTYALDSAVVKLTGAQTIAGVKTFSNRIVVDIDTTTNNAAFFKNVSTNGYGVSIQGGVGTNYALYVSNNVGSKVFEVLGNGATSIIGSLAVTGTGSFTGALTGTSATFSSSATIQNLSTSAYLNLDAASTGVTSGFRFYSDGSIKWIQGMAASSPYRYSIGKATSSTTFTQNFGIDYSTGAATFSSSIDMGLNKLFTGGGYKMHYRNSTVNITFSGTSNWQINNDADNAALMTVLNGGNVGIGTTSPSHPLTVVNPTSNFNTISMINNSSNLARLSFVQNGSTTLAYSAIEGDGRSSGYLAFRTDDTERMRITSGGELFVGATTQPGAGNATTGACFGPSGYIIGQRNAAAVGYFGRGTDNGQLLVFYRGTTEVGSISVTTVLTTYNTTSDYRLKEDLKPINGLDIVNRIKVYDYKWKSEDSRMNGVLAHELAEVLPYAVTGIKDGEQMQSVDYSKIVPVMVQAIKELKAELDTLKNK